MNFDFQNSVKRFNYVFNLPVSNKPCVPAVQRLKDFRSILMEEISEIDEVITKIETKELSDAEIIADFADWLGDISVYAMSEAIKHGINLSAVLRIIMESNFSKLNKFGEIDYDTRGKVLKGENYVAPEPKILELIKEEQQNG